MEKQYVIKIEFYKSILTRNASLNKNHMVYPRNRYLYSNESCQQTLQRKIESGKVIKLSFVKLGGIILLMYGGTQGLFRTLPFKSCC